MLKKDPTVIAKLEGFFAPYQAVSYRKGESILRAEDMPYGVYYLKEGFVRQYLLSRSGETFIVHIYKPGSFFPLTWLINDTPNTFYFEAMTKAVVVRASKDTFLDFLKQHPDVLLYATQRLAAGLHGLVTRVSQLVLDDAFTKTVLLLLYYADNFGEKTAEGIAITVPLAHREVASWIGTTRETASLQMEQLKRKGIIATKGRSLTIKRLDLLEREATAGRVIE
jgi:CRP/FNR family transcriptional regulator